LTFLCLNTVEVLRMQTLIICGAVLVVLGFLLVIAGQNDWLSDVASGLLRIGVVLLFVVVVWSACRSYITRSLSPPALVEQRQN